MCVFVVGCACIFTMRDRCDGIESNTKLYVLFIFVDFYSRKYNWYHSSFFDYWIDFTGKYREQFVLHSISKWQVWDGVWREMVQKRSLATRCLLSPRQVYLTGPFFRHQLASAAPKKIRPLNFWIFSYNLFTSILSLEILSQISLLNCPEHTNINITQNKIVNSMKCKKFCSYFFPFNIEILVIRWNSKGCHNSCWM